MAAADTAGASHYTVLNLPGPPHPLKKADLKNAYHRSLLQHHPDKSGKISRYQNGSSGFTYTVDQITTAYKVLSDPLARAEYDRALRLAGGHSNGVNGRSGGDGQDDGSFRTGLEIFDLDDLEEGEEEVGGHEESVWFHSCRCGDEQGFRVRESDLEKEAEWGEIVVGCRGCSLWARVTFAVESDGDEEDGEENGDRAYEGSGRDGGKEGIS